MLEEKENLCHRCKTQKGLIHCDECIKGGFYCESCDNYLHSLPSKKEHKRYLEEPINNQQLPQYNSTYSISPNPYDNSQLPPTSIYNTNNAVNNTNTQIPPTVYNTNTPNYSDTYGNNYLSYQLNYQNNFNQNPSNEYNSYSDTPSNQNESNSIIYNMPDNDKPLKPEAYPTQVYINEIKNIYEKERGDLILKLEDLQRMLDETKREMGNRIDFLHNNLEETHKNHEMEITCVNNDHFSEMSDIITDKDNQLQALADELQNERRANQEIKSKIVDTDAQLKEHKMVYNQMIDEYNIKIDEAKKEKEDTEDFYRKKIEELKELHQKEKDTIIKSYEMAIEKLNQTYLENKSKFNTYIEERENYIKETTADQEKEKEDLMNELKEEREKEENLKNDWDSLEELNKQRVEELKELREEYQQLQDDNSMLDKEGKKLFNEATFLGQAIQGLKKKKDALNNIIYGKFKK